MRRRLLALLLLALALRLWVAVAFPLIGQEAYHWEYATHLSLSYFDHPPLVGWAIFLGSKLFGSGPFGIRAFFLLFSVGTTLIGLAFVRDLGEENRPRSCG